MAEQTTTGPAESRSVVLTPAELLVRMVEPHLVGIHEAGEPMLSGYQTGGFSHSGDLPGWRTFITSKIDSVEPRSETFTPRSDYNRMAGGMLEVFARA